ncbi:MAG: hypothetical protein EBZ26_03645 [Flavobacteriia bacterium]|nr:hypothetical protein [Flavobacteriia bacterium]
MNATYVHLLVNHLPLFGALSRWTPLTLWTVAALGAATCVTAGIAAETGGHIIHTEVHGSDSDAGEHGSDAHPEHED